jgi:CheY-like chemotaxis protein
VECVPNGKAALMAVIARPPDLVILDLHMPEMDGGNFLEIIRSYLRLQSLPVIVLTGLPDSPMVDRARHLKVNTILVKAKATLEDIAEAVRTELHRLPS